MVTRSAEDEARISELTRHLRLAEEEATLARSELGSERSHRLKIEGSFMVTLE